MLFKKGEREDEKDEALWRNYLGCVWITACCHLALDGIRHANEWKSIIIMFGFLALFIVCSICGIEVIKSALHKNKKPEGEQMSKIVLASQNKLAIGCFLFIIGACLFVTAAMALIVSFSEVILSRAIVSIAVGLISASIGFFLILTSFKKA